jgi:hypothetical protein
MNEVQGLPFPAWLRLMLPEVRQFLCQLLLTSVSLPILLEVLPVSGDQVVLLLMMLQEVRQFLCQLRLTSLPLPILLYVLLVGFLLMMLLGLILLCSYKFSWNNMMTSVTMKG